MENIRTMHLLEFSKAISAPKSAPPAFKGPEKEENKGKFSAAFSNYRTIPNQLKISRGVSLPLK
jgi:hypothetical protein